jgi:thiamine biosynthesis lipoprotein ApbE
MTFTTASAVAPVLTDDEMMGLLDIAIEYWRKGRNTYEIAIEATGELGKRINECVVANLLAGYFAGGR